MKAKEVIEKKGTKVFTSSPSYSIKNALNCMIENKVGSLIIVDDKKCPIGIITERDVLRLVNQKEDWQNCTVGEYMTKKLVIGLLDDDLEYIMSLMTLNYFRHVPILDEGKIAGIISIGDIVKAQLKDYKSDNRYLSDYIASKYPA